MKTKRTTRIFHDTFEVLSVRQHAYVLPLQAILLCEQCDAAVQLVSLEEAVAIAGVSARAIYRMAEDGLIHFRESAEGLLLVCLNSLIKSYPAPE
jgi:hypothetical protein